MNRIHRAEPACLIFVFRIAAQVVDYNDLINAGSESGAKSAGKIRTEGKTYVMQANDIVEFRFNV